jgi:hypothetical protein
MSEAGRFQAAFWIWDRSHSLRRLHDLGSAFRLYAARATSPFDSYRPCRPGCNGAYSRQPDRHTVAYARVSDELAAPT